MYLIFLYSLLFFSPNHSSHFPPQLTWKFVSVEDDMGNPRTSIYLIINDKEHLIGKGTGNFNTLEKELYAEKQYQIPSNALTACAGFWAGLGHQLYVVQKGNILEVKEGFLDAESPKGTRVKFKTIKKITI